MYLPKYVVWNSSLKLTFLNTNKLHLSPVSWQYPIGTVTEISWRRSLHLSFQATRSTIAGPICIVYQSQIRGIHNCGMSILYSLSIQGIQAHVHVDMVLHSYVNIHIQMHTCIHAYINTYIQTYIHTYFLTHLRACMLACLNTDILTYLLTYFLTHLHDCMLAYLHTYIISYTLIHAYNICICIHLTYTSNNSTTMDFSFYSVPPLDTYPREGR